MNKPEPAPDIAGHIGSFLQAYNAGANNQPLSDLPCQCDCCLQAYAIGQELREGSITGQAERKEVGFGETGPF